MGMQACENFIFLKKLNPVNLFHDVLRLCWLNEIYKFQIRAAI